MPSNGEPCAGVFSRPVFTRAGRLAIGFASLAIATAPCAIGLAAAQDVAPVVSAERIEDVPSTRVDPFPEFDNFAWRAFIALNWPALTDPAHRGVPDRAKTLGDRGPRVWETFKARYELFQVGPDGRPFAPQPWATYEALNPCGADVDGRAKTLATFDPFMDFNQSAFLPGVAANPLVAQNAPIPATKCASTNRSIRRLRLSGWSLGEKLPDEAHPARIARRLDRGQGRMAAAHRGGHAGGAGALLRSRERQCGRRRQDARRRPCRLFEKRRRAGRPAHRDPDEIPAARTVEHVRARRQRAAGRPRRSARAGRQGRGRALFLFRRVEAEARPVAAVRLARHVSGQHAIIRPRSTPRRCRWCAGIRSIPRPWR